MSDRTFIDTNVLVYLFDSSARMKQEKARQLVSELGRSGSAVISTQVLQEFFVSVARKLSPPLSHKEAATATARLLSFNVIQTDTPMILHAIERSGRDAISLWDSLIVEAALAGDCRVLLSEDLQHGRRFESLRIENPFA